jgi:hypothetical protein
LRFDWERTWKAQHAAGLRFDSTLGFNDRPGFRTGAALSYTPWELSCEGIDDFITTPMVIMDSHFFDYRPMTSEERATAIGRWIGEVRSVRGQACINWHPHTLAACYGWGDGFQEIIEMLSRRPKD